MKTILFCLLLTSSLQSFSQDLNPINGCPDIRNIRVVNTNNVALPNEYYLAFKWINPTSGRRFMKVEVYDNQILIMPGTCIEIKKSNAADANTEYRSVNFTIPSGGLPSFRFSFSTGNNCENERCGVIWILAACCGTDN